MHGSMPCQSQVLDSMDNDEVRIAIGLRLGAHFCHPLCHQCGAQVDELATHGLSCMTSAGRQSRHTAFIDIIKRSLASAHGRNKPVSILHPGHSMHFPHSTGCGTCSWILHIYSLSHNSIVVQITLFSN